LFSIINKSVAKPNKIHRVKKTKTKAKKLLLIFSPKVLMMLKKSQATNKISDDSQRPNKVGTKAIAGTK